MILEQLHKDKNFIKKELSEYKYSGEKEGEARAIVDYISSLIKKIENGELKKEKMVPLKDLFNEAKKKHKMSRKPKNESRNEVDTGFFRTKKAFCQSCKNKFTYKYKYFDVDQEKKKAISSVDLLELRRKVQEKGLEWKIDKYYKARKTAKEVGLPLKDLQ